MKKSRKYKSKKQAKYRPKQNAFEDDEFSNQPIDQVLKNLFQNNRQNFTSDFVEYHIFLTNPAHSVLYGEETQWNEPIVTQKSREIHQFLMDRIPKNYIWQGDVFNLELISPQEEIEELKELEIPLRNHQPIYPILHGRISFTETTIDEWFVTYLMFELSKAFPNDVVIQINDQDGEFLLIESSMHIEEWMNEDPQLTSNRVFIFNGQLHIIPDQPATPSHFYYEVFPVKTPVANIHKAVEMIVKEHKYCIANESVQGDIVSRLKSFPSEANSYGSQRVTCYLPIDIIRLLEAQPQIISKAIYYLTNRNSITEKFLEECSRFSPKPSSQEADNIRDTFAHTTVNMNRCQYVQLLSLRMDPIPSKLMSIYKPNERRTEEQHKAYDFGLKILCGFEMLYHSEKPLELFDTFDKYLNHLHTQGYFGMELKGTEPYQKLEESAKNFYNMFSSSSKCFVVEQWIDQCKSLTIKEVRQRKLRTDPDDWMDMVNEEIENYMAQKGMTKLDDDTDIEKTAKDLLQGIKSFVEEAKSGHEGINHTEGATKQYDSIDATSQSKTSRLDALLETLQSMSLEERIEKFNLKDEAYLQSMNDPYLNPENDHDDDSDDWEDEEITDPEMVNVMREMDEELLQFGKQERTDLGDRHIMENLLRSFQAQGSDSGPTSLLFEHLGWNLPKASEDGDL